VDLQSPGYHNELDWSDTMTIKAIYENGVFRPTEPVDIAELTPVEVIVPTGNPIERTNQQEIFDLLRQSFPSGQTDIAERHNEHRP
jgi:predicted DNA-binding antitoxin AbrB/MazE fold protein